MEMNMWSAAQQSASRVASLVTERLFRPGGLAPGVALHETHLLRGFSPHGELCSTTRVMEWKKMNTLGTVFVPGVTSGCRLNAGVYFEKYVKGRHGQSLWVRNLQLSIYGVPLSIAYSYLRDGRRGLAL